MSEPTYKIIRFYQNLDFQAEVIAYGLTYDEALAHCNDPETSSDTCTLEEGIRRTDVRGPWFDGYTREESE